MNEKRDIGGGREEIQGREWGDGSTGGGTRNIRKYEQEQYSRRCEEGQEKYERGRGIQLRM